VKSPCKLYLTYRSEYLVLQDLCVGVRDRSSGAWLPLHTAVTAQVLGPLANTEDSALPTTRVRVGERLCEADRHWRALFTPTDPRHSAIRLAR
jgi:hypothetical protein